MRVTCKHCGGPHPAFECRKRSDSTRAMEPTPTSDARRDAVRVTARKDGHPSTAARKDVHEETRRLETPAGGLTRIDQSLGPMQQAGTQALPVDTNSPHECDEAPTSKSMGATTSAGTVGNEDRQPKFDRKTWMREYQRNYMRNVYRPKLKASKALSSQPQKGE